MIFSQTIAIYDHFFILSHLAFIPLSHLLMTFALLIVLLHFLQFMAFGLFKYLSRCIILSYYLPTYTISGRGISGNPWELGRLRLY